METSAPTAMQSDSASTPTPVSAPTPAPTPPSKRWWIIGGLVVVAAVATAGVLFGTGAFKGDIAGGTGGITEPQNVKVTVNTDKSTITISADPQSASVDSTSLICGGKGTMGTACTSTQPIYNYSYTINDPSKKVFSLNFADTFSTYYGGSFNSDEHKNDILKSKLSPSNCARLITNAADNAKQFLAWTCSNVEIPISLIGNVLQTGVQYTAHVAIGDGKTSKEATSTFTLQNVDTPKNLKVSLDSTDTGLYKVSWDAPTSPKPFSFIQQAGSTSGADALFNYSWKIGSTTDNSVKWWWTFDWDGSKGNGASLKDADMCFVDTTVADNADPTKTVTKKAWICPYFYIPKELMQSTAVFNKTHTVSVSIGNGKTSLAAQTTFSTGMPGKKITAIQVTTDDVTKKPKSFSWTLADPEMKDAQQTYNNKPQYNYRWTITDLSQKTILWSTDWGMKGFEGASDAKCFAAKPGWMCTSVTIPKSIVDKFAYATEYFITVSAGDGQTGDDFQYKFMTDSEPSVTIGQNDASCPEEKTSKGTTSDNESVITCAFDANTIKNDTEYALTIADPNPAIADSGPLKLAYKLGIKFNGEVITPEEYLDVIPTYNYTWKLNKANNGVLWAPDLTKDFKDNQVLLNQCTKNNPLDKKAAKVWTCDYLFILTSIAEQMNVDTDYELTVTAQYGGVTLAKGGTATKKFKTAYGSMSKDFPKPGLSGSYDAENARAAFAFSLGATVASKTKELVIFRDNKEIKTIKPNSAEWGDGEFYDATAENGKTHTYRLGVRALTDNIAAQSDDVKITVPTMESQYPAPTLNGSAEDDGSISLTWSTGPVYQKKDVVKNITIIRQPNAVMKTIPFAGNDAEYTDTTVVDGGTYTYTLQLVNPAGKVLATSTPKTITAKKKAPENKPPVNQPPTTPNIIQPTAGAPKPDTKIAWTPSNDDGIGSQKTTDGKGLVVTYSWKITDGSVAADKFDTAAAIWEVPAKFATTQTIYSPGYDGKCLFDTGNGTSAWKCVEVMIPDSIKTKLAGVTDKTYRLGVRATDGEKTSVWGQTLFAVKGTQEKGDILVSIPNAGVVKNGNTYSVKLNWNLTKPSSDVKSYKVYRSTKGSSAVFEQSALVTATVNTTWTVNNLAAGSVYYFAVKGYDANQNEVAISNIAPAVLGITKLPADFLSSLGSVLLTGIYNKGAALSWKQGSVLPNGLSVSKYTVHRFASANSTPDANNRIGETVATTYVDANAPTNALTATTSYYAVVLELTNHFDGGVKLAATVSNVVSVAVPAVAPIASTLAVPAIVLPNATVGVAYSNVVSATGGTAPYTWSIQSGTLPAGLTLNPNGTISGTPTTAETSSFKLIVTDAAKTSLNNISASIIVNAAAINPPAGEPPKITASSVTDASGYVLVRFAVASGAGSDSKPVYAIVTVNGRKVAMFTEVFAAKKDYTYEVALLPFEIKNGDVVKVSITGAAANENYGSQSVTYTAAATGGGGGGNPAPNPLAVPTTALPNATVGTAYSTSLNATGGTAPYTWSVATGTLPAGLTLNPNGTISGTPTTAETSSFALKVTDTANASVDNISTGIIVNAAAANPAPNPLAIPTTALPNATVGTAYSTSLNATGGTAPYTWSIVSGALPSSLPLAANGAIAGTPTTASSYEFVARVTDASNATVTASMTLIVNPGTIVVDNGGGGGGGGGGGNGGNSSGNGGGGGGGGPAYNNYGGGGAAMPINNATPPITMPSAKPKFTFTFDNKANPFVDTIGHWSRDFVSMLYNAKIIQGYNKTKFGPENRVTRAEFLKVVLLSLKYPVMPKASSTPFKDISTTSWYAPYFVVAQQYGIVSGNNGFARPNDPTTRAEALKMLFVALAKPQQDFIVKQQLIVASVTTDVTKAAFRDVDMTQWYAKYFVTAKNYGIVTGFGDGSARPGDQLTRGQIAKIVIMTVQQLAVE